MKSKGLICVLAACGALAFGQTQVDLKGQGRNVDFAALPSVRPFPTGAALPSTCVTGNMYFNTGASAGSNLYGCISPNIWMAEGASSGVTGLLNISASSTVLTVGTGCTVSVPCEARVGSVVYSFTSQSTITLSGGSGVVYVYVDRNGTMTAGESAIGSPSLTCSTGCQVVASITQFPQDAVPLAIWTASNGTWMTSLDQRALLSTAPSFIAGPNVTLTPAGNTVTIAASLTTLPTGSQPACSASTGGDMWYSQGASGVKDSVQVCAKDATNTYAWRTVY